MIRTARVVGIAFGLLALPLVAGAQQNSGATLFQSRGCVACHGTDGSTSLLPTYPKLRGNNEQYLLNQMKDIKSGARANGNSAAMKGVMHLVSDAEIDAIADYVSKLKP